MKVKIALKSLIIGICCLLLPMQSLWAQKAPLKWGKISASEWDLQEVAYDQEATAAILFDYATAKFNSGILSISYHKRIKILKDPGIELADVQIPFYSKDGTQRVVALKAQTHNPQSGVKQLSNQDFYTTEVSSEWSKVSFTFPNAEVGSIIEYSYTLTSENVVFLRTWDFQDDYPTLHSEFRAAIPEYLSYKVVLQGRRVTQKYKGSASGIWVLNNLEALKTEPYMTTINDFRERLRFQLSGYYKKGSSIAGGVEFQSMMTTWKGLGEELWGNPWFGDQLKRRGMAKSISESSLQLKGDQLQKLKDIYAYVSQNYNWNGDYELVAPSLKEAVENREGTSGDLNLLLCLLLNYHDIEAEPVLVSTRDHGAVNKNIALLTQFNHVIVRAKIGEDYVLMNATDPLRPYNLLAEQDLNKFGLVVPSKQEPHWIELEPAKNNVRTIMINIDLADLQDPEVSVQGSYNGLFATSLRRKIKKNSDVILPTKAEVKLDLTAKNEEDLIKPLIVASENVDLEILENGSYLYLEPMFLNFYPENPFKAEKRNYPIDFGSPFKELYTITITIPEGYSVEEIPEETSLKLPRNYAYFQYFTDVNPQQITLTTRMGINNPTMGYGMYSSLQQFYDLLIEKLNAQVVLKKN